MTILSPASFESESVPSRIISPTLVSFSNKTFWFASVLSESVPSRIIFLPDSEVATLSPEPRPSESNPS